MPWPLRLWLTHTLHNFLSQPDFIAYKFADRKSLSPWVCRAFWKPAFVSWTLKTKEDFDTAVSEGWIPIFEDFRP